MIVLTQTLGAFYWCRVLYRAHVPVLDSPECVTYQWLSLAGMVLVLGGIILFGGSLLVRSIRGKSDV